MNNTMNIDLEYLDELDNLNNLDSKKIQLLKNMVEELNGKVISAYKKVQENKQNCKLLIDIMGEQNGALKG